MSCGCNNNATFPERTIFTFPTGIVCRARWPGSGEALMIHECKSGKMAALLNSLFFVFKISFLSKYRVKYYDYIVNWCSLINCNSLINCTWCVSLDIAQMLALIRHTVGKYTNHLGKYLPYFSTNAPKSFYSRIS